MSRKQRPETLEELLHVAVHRHPELSLSQIAELLGVQEYVLYEAANPRQKRQFPLRLLIPLARVTGDTSLIEHAAAAVGLVTFRVRRKGKTRLEHVEDLQECLQTFAELLKELAGVFRDQRAVDKREALKRIDRFMGTLAGVRQDVENLSDQLDLGLEE